MFGEMQEGCSGEGCLKGGVQESGPGFKIPGGMLRERDGLWSGCRREPWRRDASVTGYRGILDGEIQDQHC